MPGPLSYPLHDVTAARALDSAGKREAVIEAGKQIHTGKTTHNKSSNKVPVSIENAPKRLAIRIAEWDKLKDKSGFHRPGSNKK